MSRRSLRSTLVELVALVVVCGALVSAAIENAGDLSAYTSLPMQLSTAVLLVLFGTCLGLTLYAAWSSREPQSDFANILGLQEFLRRHDTLLAPNLEDRDRATVLDRLQGLARREDVVDVRVGILHGEGAAADHVIVDTFASRNLISDWADELMSEVTFLEKVRHPISGRRRTVHTVKFVWD